MRKGPVCLETTENLAGMLGHKVGMVNKEARKSGSRMSWAISKYLNFICMIRFPFRKIIHTIL